MRYIIGFIAGLATAWAALAIWQHLPGLPVEPEDIAVPPAHEEDLARSLRKISYLGPGVGA